MIILVAKQLVDGRWRDFQISNAVGEKMSFNGQEYTITAVNGSKITLELR